MRRPLVLFRSDAHILDLIQRGDEEALVILHHAHRRAITGYVLKNSGTNDDAQDVLQESLVILWERIRSGRFQQTAQLGTFLFGIAKNLWRRSLARSRRESPLDAESEVSDDAISALERMVGEEEKIMVAEALEGIGETCRQLLLLYYWEELSMEQIAVRMGFANAATAKSKKYQCKRILERILSEHLKSDEQR
jgi:RNA polymerase sigma factor (sigma-70 family)